MQETNTFREGIVSVTDLNENRSNEENQDILALNLQKVDTLKESDRFVENVCSFHLHGSLDRGANR